MVVFGPIFKNGWPVPDTGFGSNTRLNAANQKFTFTLFAAFTRLTWDSSKRRASNPVHAGFFFFCQTSGGKRLGYLNDVFKAKNTYRVH